MSSSVVGLARGAEESSMLVTLVTRIRTLVRSAGAARHADVSGSGLTLLCCLLQ